MSQPCNGSLLARVRTSVIQALARLRRPGYSIAFVALLQFAALIPAVPTAPVAAQESDAQISEATPTVSSPPSDAEEVAALRTPTSKTFQNPDGTLTSEIFSGPIHYESASGDLKPIDTELVASNDSGYAYETAATGYEFLVPEDISEAPLVVVDDGHEVKFQPEGAVGSPVVEGPRVTFANAYPGVDLTYEATPTGVRELLVVHSEAAIGDFSFDVDLDGASANPQPSGEVLLENDGEPFAQLDTPYVYELSDPTSATQRPVDLHVSQDSARGLTVTLDTAESWLANDARDYPVVIDPTITLETPARDCWINGSQPNESNCGASANFIRAGYYGSPRRGLLRFDLSSIPTTNVTVSSATTKLYLDATQSMNGNSAGYKLWRTTKNWTNEATWNKWNSTDNWSTLGGGGDWEPDYVGGGQTMGGQTSGYKTFDSTDLVQAWVAGTVNNRGMILKQHGDPVTNVLHFVSSDHAEAIDKGPKLVVTYSEPAATAFDKIGERDIFTYESQRLNDRTELKVNVATGNLLVKQSDISLSGTGLNFSFDRYYNSLTTASDPAKLSTGWSTGTASTVRLIPGTNGRVTFVGPSGYRVRFDRNAWSGYSAAEPGIKADLKDVTGGGYELTWHSKETWHFDSSGKLTQQKDKNGNTITFAYTNGDLTKVTDTRGKEINLTYTNGLLATVTDTSLGRTFTYGYTNGRLTSSELSAYTTNPDDTNIGKKTRYSYDSAGRLWKITDPTAAQTVTEITYTNGPDRPNRVASIERYANGATDGPTTGFDYFTTPTDCQGANNAEAMTEVNGPRADVDVPNTARNPEDSSGDDITTYCYDEHERVRETIDAKGNKRSTKYTSNSNVAQLTEAGVGASTTIGYDAGGNATSMKLPSGGTAHMSYGDSQNEHFITGVKDFAVGSDTGADSWSYDYDNKGNLIEAKAPNEGSLIQFRYCYDAKGNLDRIDQHPTTVLLDESASSGCRDEGTQNNDTLFTYDTQGRLTKVDPPGPNATYEITQYDGASRVKQTKDGKGNVSSYTYDALDRVVEIETKNAAGTITTRTKYLHDANGNLLKRTDVRSDNSTEEHLFTYDPLNRMTFDDPPDPNVGTTYHYDAASNLVELETYGEGTPLTYTYDEVNLVMEMTDWNHDPGGNDPRVTLFEHGDRNQRTKTTYPGGVVMESAYDESRRLLCTYSYKGTRPTSIPSNSECPTASSAYIAYSKYGYNDGGGKDTNRRESYTDRFGVTTDYDYDSIGRLLDANASSGADYQYAYDERGNVKTETAGGTTTHYAFDYANQICWSGSTAPTNSNDKYVQTCPSAAPGSNTTYGFDAAGNLTSSSAGFSASYNVMNQSTSISAPGQNALPMTYADFTQDRRLTAGPLTFSYDQLGLAEQKTGQGQPDSGRFVRDRNGTLVAMTHNDVNLTPDDLYYHFDGLGSVVATTDPSGDVVKRYTYEPYGKQTNLAENGADYNPWRYASGYYDKQTKLLKFGTRYYDPEILRWTQPDPEMGKPDQPMTLNAYSYVGGNPINSTDSSGRFYVDFSVSIGPVTLGVAINAEEDGSVGSIHPYFGTGASKAPVSASASVGTGQVESGMDCFQGQGSLGASGSGGYCPGHGEFAEAGVGSPQASAGWIHYL
jgi:RHS repeat-associated protein